MHKAEDIENETMITISVQADKKTSILKELHQLNINQFTTYYDLDHFASKEEIKKSWGLD